MSDFQTVEACARIVAGCDAKRTGKFRWVTGIGVTLTVALLALLGVIGTKAGGTISTMHEKIHEVDAEVSAHIAGNDKEIKAIHEAVKRIETSQDVLTTRINKVLEKNGG